MENMGGLIELVLVFGFVLGFAILELRSVRRYRKCKAAEDAAVSPDPVEGEIPEAGRTTPQK